MTPNDGIRDQNIKKMKVEARANVFITNNMLPKKLVDHSLNKHVLQQAEPLKACKIPLSKMSHEEMKMKIEETKQKLKEQYEEKAAARSCSMRTAYNHQVCKEQRRRSVGGKEKEGGKCFNLRVGTSKLRGNNISNEQQAKEKQGTAHQRIIQRIQIMKGRK